MMACRRRHRRVSRPRWAQANTRIPYFNAGVDESGGCFDAQENLEISESGCGVDGGCGSDDGLGNGLSAAERVEVPAGGEVLQPM